MLNPYTDTTFFSFFSLLFYRLVCFLRGEPCALAQDEVQLFTLSMVALSASLVGVFLVLRRMTLLANALTHTTLFGIVVVHLIPLFLFGSASHHLPIPLLILSGLISALLTTLTTEGLHRLFKLQEDASVGLVFSFYFALGVTLLSLLSKSTHLGTELITGNADAVDFQDIYLSLGVLVVNASILLVTFRGLKFSTFDPLSAKLSGFSPARLNFILMVLTSLTCVSALRAVGALPLLVFITLPPLCARLLTHSLATLIVLSLFCSMGSVAIGVALSRHILTVTGFGLSTGGIITAILSLIYVMFSLLLYAMRIWPQALTYRNLFTSMSPFYSNAPRKHS